MAAVVPFRIGKKVFGNVTAVMSPFTCLHETEVDTIRSGWLNVTRVFLRRENDLSKLSSHDQSSNTLPAKHAVGQSTSGSSVRHLRESLARSHVLRCVLTWATQGNCSPDGDVQRVFLLLFGHGSDCGSGGEVSRKRNRGEAPTIRNRSW